MFNKKKAFFKEKIDQVTKSIWELEFKVSKSAQVREGVRKDRDQSLDQLAQVEAQLKGIKDKKLREPIEKRVKDLQENIARFEAQMKMIDDQIAGNPKEGITGINETLGSLAELREMYKDYVSKL